jgi:hypothetical protein
MHSQLFLFSATVWGDLNAYAVFVTLSAIFVEIGLVSLLSCIQYVFIRRMDLDPVGRISVPRDEYPISWGWDYTGLLTFL